MQTTARKLLKRGVFLLLALIVASALALLVMLSNASVRTTASGAATSLRLPLPRGKAIAFPILVATPDKPRIAGFLDGPVVRPIGEGTWSAVWFCEDSAHRAEATDVTLRIDCAGRQHEYQLRSPAIPAATSGMPSRVAVLSDLEGNIDFLDKALRRLGIVDAKGDWSYGTGHLVILGDSVDRGRDVFAVLWRLHDLSARASESGGAVHVLLGNHEQYILRTNPSRANSDHLHALNAMGGYQQAFADDTIIGRWLRRQPVIVKLGDVLFTHAGVSPDVTRTGLSIEQLNSAMHGYWARTGARHASSPALDAVLGLTGVTQYRGYFRAKDDAYPEATSEDVSDALAHFGASRIVVAHTIVDEVQTLHDGRVFAVDVNSDEARPQVLRFDNGAPRVIDIGIKRNINDQESKLSREFNLSDQQDRRMLYAMIKDLRRLSAMPFPY